MTRKYLWLCKIDISNIELTENLTKTISSNLVMFLFIWNMLKTICIIMVPAGQGLNLIYICGRSRTRGKLYIHTGPAGLYCLPGSWHFPQRVTFHLDVESRRHVRVERVPLQGDAGRVTTFTLSPSLEYAIDADTKPDGWQHWYNHHNHDKHNLRGALRRHRHHNCQQ